MTLTAKPLLGAFLVLFGALFCPRFARADPPWTLVWDDEFNGAANAPPDPTRWTYDLGGGGWGNGELETYTSATANVYQDGNGHLVIQAQDNGGNYTSARIKSFGLFDQAYGMVEASIELPAGTAEGSGLWPAFWMLGSNINTATWPLCGEIDIMENIGQYNTAVQNGGHIHGPVEPGGGDYNGGDGVGTTYTFPAGEAMNTGFHLYAVSWTPTSITFYVDGVAYQTLTAASLPAGGEWVFNHPFFIIMNLALGGPVGGAVTAAFPQQLLVDYVRVFKLTDNGTSPYGGAAPTLPGTLECANYDSYDDTTDPTEPGEGFSYNGLNSAQTNGVYRTGDAVSTEDCSDVDPYDCDYTSPGQWLQYTVNVAQSGVYTADARVASDGPGGTFHIDVDGTTVTGEMTAPNTGGWQTWGDVSASGITLGAGTHVVLLDEDSMGSGGLGVCNFEYLTFSLETSPTPNLSPSSTLSPTRSATPTLSLTSTLSPTRSATQTLSLTSTLSPTHSASPTLSLTETSTPSPIDTLTPSATSSYSPTASATPGMSATASPTLSQSSTLTPASSSSVSATPSSTSSHSLTATLSSTQTPSGTPTPTASPSLTPSVTLTPVLTGTPTATVSVTPIPPVTPTATPTVSWSPAATASTTSVHPHGAGSGVIVKVEPVPNPNPSDFAVELDGECPSLRVQIYTEGMVLDQEWTAPAEGPGWVRIAIPAQFRAQASNGTYYYRVLAGDSVGKAVVGRLVLLR